MNSDDILNLLKENPRVIIPDLGTFMIKPTDRSVVFNEFLKFNDGLLIDYLIKKRNIDKLSAIKEINKFNDRVHQTLDKEKQFDMGALGILILDKSEKIQLQKTTKTENTFQQHEDIQNNDNKIETLIKNYPYTTTEISQSQQEANSSMYNLEVRSDLEYPETLVNNEVIINKAIRRKKVFVFFTVTILTVIIVLYIAFFRDSTFIEQIQHSKSFNAPEQSSPIPKATQSQSPVTPKIIKEQTVSAPIKSSGSEKPKEIQKGEKTDGQTPDKKEIEKPMATKVAVTLPQKSVPDISNESNNTKKYHIIAGVFSLEANADKFIQQLKKQGYDAKIIRKQGVHCYVSYSSFSTSEEAQAQLKAIQTSGHTGWIMKF